MGYGEKVIKSRIAGRKMADEVVELIGDPMADLQFVDAMIERLKTVAGLCPIASDAAITIQPIARLGATVMPFGEHQHKRFDDVPLNYLDWLCSSQEEFYKHLRAYLKHPDLESRRRGIDP